MENQVENTNIKEKRKLLQSQDMKFTKALAGNDKKVRDRALKNLKEWFSTRSAQIPFTQDDFLRIWKGLFTAMWMSDKPLIQEECAENIANLIHYVDSNSAVQFFKSGLILMSLEWYGIDQWRLDKFLMLVRRMFRQCFEFLKKSNWDLSIITEFNDILTGTILQTDNLKFLGLTMHATEIFLEELAKVSNGKIGHRVVSEFVKPFIKQLSLIEDRRHIKHITKHIFHHLMQQSDIGLEHEAKFDAWKRQGFPGGSIDVMEKTDLDSSDEGEEEETDLKILDPRAGQVDVVLPQLKFNPLEIDRLLKQFKFSKKSTTNGRNAITKLQHELTQMAEGAYPLGITKVPIPEKDDYIRIDESIRRLQNFERILRAKKRKLNLDEQCNGESINIFASKLQDFVEKSEGKIKKRKLLKKRKPFENDLNWSYENAFKRNSGVWKVYRLNTSVTESPSKSGTDKVTSSPNLVNGDLHKKSKENPWSQPLRKGETEIFIPSKKFQSKIRSKSLSALNNSVKSPKSVVHRKIPKSEKKVRIALKLNQSQEIHEHVAQIKSSPGIPYDANRKPEKPLLKPNAIQSPINPFYKRKLKL